MMRTFFTSDTHYWHKGVIKHSKRPFASIEDMNEALIERHNAVVRPDDTIWHLGDLSLAGRERTSDILVRLNGRKRWVWGNHDEDLMKKAGLQFHFEWSGNYAQIKIKDDQADGGYQRLVLSHYPMLSWNRMHYKAWMLHGHCHGNLLHPYPNMRLVDVGVDVWDYTPVAYEQVRDYMKGRVLHPADHHTEKAT